MNYYIVKELRDAFVKKKNTMKYDETNIKYYLYHIDEFIEEVFDVKLMPYQKTLIRKFPAKDIFYNYMTTLCCNLAENKEETGECIENK